MSRGLLTPDLSSRETLSSRKRQKTERPHCSSYTRSSVDAVLYLLEVEVRIYSLIRRVVLPLTQAISKFVYPFFDGFYITINREGE